MCKQIPGQHTIETAIIQYNKSKIQTITKPKIIIKQQKRKENREKRNPGVIQLNSIHVEPELVVSINLSGAKGIIMSAPVNTHYRNGFFYSLFLEPW